MYDTESMMDSGNKKIFWCRESTIRCMVEEKTGTGKGVKWSDYLRYIWL